MSRSYALFDTALGRCAIAWTDEGVCALHLFESEWVLQRRIAEQGSLAEKIPRAVRTAIDAIRKHLENGNEDLSSIPIALVNVGPFKQRVYDLTRKIPPGETRSYGELAARAGSAGAARAVGQAMRTNPMPLLIPCHRVVGADGKLVGFSAIGGLATKKRLIALESEQPSLAIFARHDDTLTFEWEEATAHLCKVDARLGKLIEAVGERRLEIEPKQDTFEALARSIVYQQLSGKAAATIFARVKTACEGKFGAQGITRTSDGALRGAGLSQSKLLALRDLSAKVLAGDVPKLEDLRSMSDDQIVERLTTVRGIGRWTVEMLLIFRLGRSDVLPVADYGVRKGFARIYKTKDLPTPAELQKRGERWRPYRTAASWYLWRALELSPASLKAPANSKSKKNDRH